MMGGLASFVPSTPHLLPISFAHLIVELRSWLSPLRHRARNYGDRGSRNIPLVLFAGQPKWYILLS
jgi:hypothetical protein